MIYTIQIKGSRIAYYLIINGCKITKKNGMRSFQVILMRNYSKVLWDA